MRTAALLFCLPLLIACSSDQPSDPAPAPNNVVTTGPESVKPTPADKETEAPELSPEELQARKAAFDELMQTWDLNQALSEDSPLVPMLERGDAEALQRGFAGSVIALKAYQGTEPKGSEEWRKWAGKRNAALDAEAAERVAARTIILRMAEELGIEDHQDLAGWLARVERDLQLLESVRVDLGAATE